MNMTAVAAPQVLEPTARTVERPSIDDAPRVVVIDRRPLIRMGLSRLVQRTLGHASQAAKDPAQAVAALRLLGAEPRAVLLGLASGDDPHRLLADARRLRVPVVCVLSGNDPAMIRAALGAGADGYLLLDEIDPGSLETALARVESGEYVLPAELEPHRAQDRRPMLTDRCLEVLAALADGLHDDEIADRLGISTSSVRKHIANAQDRLTARTRTQVVAIVAGHGLL
jgi:DNA-binding NarL/FixJ family response regulator